MLPIIRETKHFKFDQGNFGTLQHRFYFPLLLHVAQIPKAQSAAH
jgi:hypothetical protein